MMEPMCDLYFARVGWTDRTRGLDGPHAWTGRTARVGWTDRTRAVHETYVFSFFLE